MSVTIGKDKIRFKCEALPDSGTSRTIVKESILRQANIAFDVTQKSRISACNSSALTCLGTAEFTIIYGDTSINVRALVTPNLSENMLISYNDLIRLGILHEDFPTPIFSSARVSAIRTPLSFERLCTKYADVFDDKTVTPMAGKPMEVHLRRDDPAYKPIHVTSARKVPLHFQTEADKTLKLFLDSGVIEKVPTTEHIEWCSPGFFVPKPDGKVRLVVDYRTINRFIDRPVHPFPSPRDILKDIKPDSRWFMKLDALQGYYQVPLTEQSKSLTCFLLPSGRYRFTRAPMGMSCSSDGFSEKMDLIFSSVPDLLKMLSTKQFNSK